MVDEKELIAFYYREVIRGMTETKEAIKKLTGQIRELNHFMSKRVIIVEVKGDPK